MTQEEKFQMMTAAPIPGLIGRMAVPTIISMLITSFYNMADTFFVARIGTSATAAVGVVFPIMAVIQALGFFLAMAPVILFPDVWEQKMQIPPDSWLLLAFFLLFYAGFASPFLAVYFWSPWPWLLVQPKPFCPIPKNIWELFFWVRLI